MSDMHDDIDHLRQHIDELDEQLVALLNERAATELTVGKLRKQAGARIYDPKREGEVIEKLSELNKGPLSKGAIEEVYRSIATVCREIQLQ